MSQRITILFVVIILFAGCSDPQISSPVIATIADREIDWKELRRSFYLNSRWQKGITYKTAFENQLEYLIDQKLFAKEAVKLGLDEAPEIKPYLDFIHKKEMIKELYRREVASQVKISEAQYQEAYGYLKKKVKFQYFASPSPDHIKIYMIQLQNKAFGDIQLIDMNTDEKGISPMFSYGDMAEELETVVFNLEKDQISGPVKVGSRYMAVQLVDGRIDKFMSEMDFHEKKSRIRKIIFERRTEKISGKYVEKIMADKHVKLNPESFFPLAEYFSRIIQNKNTTAPYPIYINDTEIRHTLNHMQELLKKDIVRYDGGAITVQEFLDELKSMPAGLRPQINMASALKGAVARMVRDKHLAVEAKRMGLDEDTDVLYETRIQRDEILAGYYLKKVRESITSSAWEIEDFKAKENFKVVNEQLNNQLTDEAIADVIGDYKFNLQKMKLADSLKLIYANKIDTSVLLANISDPEKIITEKPVRMTFLEKYR